MRRVYKAIAVDHAFNLGKIPKQIVKRCIEKKVGTDFEEFFTELGMPIDDIKVIKMNNPQDNAATIRDLFNK